MCFLKNSLKKEIFLFFIIVLFSGNFSPSVFAADGPLLRTPETVFGIENSGRSDACREETSEEMNPICFLDALIGLFIDLLGCEDLSVCMKSMFSNFFGCLAGCFSGADRCEDTTGLTLSPDAVTLKPGASQRFTAKGGTAPYVFVLYSDKSGAALETIDSSTADYTAGETTEVTDVVRVTDQADDIAVATITITEKTDPDSFPIGPEGGTLEHPSGFSIEFPENALEKTTTCSIILEETPEAFPEYLESFSQAFTVQLGAELVLPVKITFKNINSAEKGSLGIYILEGGDWAFAGGTQEGTTVFSCVNGLSEFRVGKGQSLHKAFDFVPVGSKDATISIVGYELSAPDKDTPISVNYSFPIVDGKKTTAVFPQGKYQFCVEWYNSFWQYRFWGTAVPAPDNYILRETDSLISPPNVNFNLIGGSLGSCPDCENMTEEPE